MKLLFWSSCTAANSRSPLMTIRLRKIVGVPLPLPMGRGQGVTSDLQAFELTSGLRVCACSGDYSSSDSEAVWHVDSGQLGLLSYLLPVLCYSPMGKHGLLNISEASNRLNFVLSRSRSRSRLKCTLPPAFSHLLHQKVPIRGQLLFTTISFSR